MSVPISAILLAAGSSKRMGCPKQLLPLGNKPAISHCLETTVASGIDDIVVVLGLHAKRIANVVEKIRVEMLRNRHFEKRRIRIKAVFNDNPDSEMADSVRIGMKEIDRSSSSVLIALSDHPLVSTETIKRMIAECDKGSEKIVIPVYLGRKGHPTIFPLQCIEEIATGLTLREILRKSSDRVKCIDVHDEGVILDMDTPEDYERIYETFRHQRADR